MVKPRHIQWMSGFVGSALLLSGAPTVWAAGKFTKKEEAVIATQTELTKPKDPTKKREEKKKPDLTASDVFGGMGEELKSVTDSQIKLLQRLIDASGDDDPEKPDYLFRMAELFAEQERYYSFKARELDEKVFDAQQASKVAEATRLKAIQADYEKKEKTWLLAAVQKYLAVANGPKFQTYKKMDQVLFYLAYLLTQVKKEEQARTFFKRLIKDYPNSPYLPHAYLSFGEFFFENKELENALKFYDRVLAYPDSPVFGFALYKKGWVYFNMTDFKSAMDTFIKVIDMTTNPKSKHTKGDAQLAKEAKKDLVRTYAQFGVPEKAWPLFQRYGKDFAPTMLELLAELYNGQGKFADSIKVYRELIKLNPGTVKLCNWQTEILKNTLSMTGSRAVPETVKELQRLSAVYERTVGMTGVKKEVVDECRDNTANTLRELATVWHKEAQKTGVPETYANAGDLYKEYLRRFPKERDAYIMTYYYAELLWALGVKDNNTSSHWYCDAAPIFSDVVKLDTKGPKLKDAAYAAVLSWKNCLDIADEGSDEKKAVEEASRTKRAANKKKGSEEKETKPEEKLAELPIPEKQLKMLEAFDAYIKYVPESAGDVKTLLIIKWRRARVFYDYNHFKQASPLFRDIAENHPKDELAIYAANLLLDTLIFEQDFKELGAQAERFAALQKQGALQEDALSKRLANIQNSIVRKVIEQQEKEGESRLAGIGYMKLADSNPNDPKYDELLYNAGLLFQKSKLIGLAIQIRDRLIRERPDSVYAKRALYRVGQSYQFIGRYEQAAERYETFAEKYSGELGKDDKGNPEKDPDKRIDAALGLNTAAVFRRGLGQTEKSIADVNKFVTNYGGRKEYYDQAAGVFFDMGQIFEQKKDYARLRGHLIEYLKNWSVKGGIDRQITAEVKLGEIAWRDSCPVAGVNGACIKVERERASAAAQLKAKSDKGKQKLKKKGQQKLGQCGPETKSKITVFERKPAQVKEAMAHFDKAIQLYKGGAAAASVTKDDQASYDARVNTMVYHVALARMSQADKEYEALLQMKVPTGLVFDPKQKKKEADSKKKFADWLKGKSSKLDATRQLYTGVILLKNASFAIAAAARIGQLYQDFADGLYTAEVPQVPAPPGMAADEWAELFRTTYCDQLTDAAEPIEKKAEEGLSICLSKSTELNWFNEWSKLCEAELNQIKPSEYPLAAELRSEPGVLFTRLDVAPPATAPVETK